MRIQDSGSALLGLRTPPHPEFWLSDPESLVLISPLFPLVAAAILLLGGLAGLRGDGRSLAVLAVLTALLASLSGGVTSPDLWGSPAPRPAAEVGAQVFHGAAFTVSRQAFLWLLATNWLALLLFLWPVNAASGHSEAPGEKREMPSIRHESFAGLLLLAISQLVVLSGNAWIQWGLVSLSGWAFALVMVACRVPRLPQPCRESHGNQTPAMIGTALGAAAGNREEPLRFHSPGAETPHKPGGGEAMRGLVTLIIADFAWLLGLRSLYGAFGTLDIPFMTSPPQIGGLGEFHFSFVVTGGFWLLIALVIRCGLFPLMGWAGELAISSRHVAWMISFPLGQGLYLLLQWEPLLSATGAQQGLTAGLAGLSALLLAVMGFGRKPRPRKFVRVTGAMIALVWLGVTASPQGDERILAFALALLVLLPLTALLLGTVVSGGRSRLLPFMASALICSGILGQESAFDAVWRGVEGRASRVEGQGDRVALTPHSSGLSLQSSAPSSGQLPAAMLGVVLISHGLASFVLFRSLFQRIRPVESGTGVSSVATDAPDRATQRAEFQQRTAAPGRSPVEGVAGSGEQPATEMTGGIELLAASGILVTLSALLVPSLLDPERVLFLPIPGGTAIVGLIALVAAYSWREGAPVTGLDPIQRLSEREFYSQSVIRACLVRPLCGFGNWLWALEWMVIERMLIAVPSVWLRRLSNAAELADEESSARQTALHVVLAAGVIVGGMLLARRL